MIRQSSLPTSYERLEYIENTSTAYIDCGILLNKKDVAALQFKVSDIKNYTNQWMGANVYLQIRCTPNSVSNGLESLYISNMDVVKAYYNDLKYYLSVNNKTIVRTWEKDINYNSSLSLFRLVGISTYFTRCKIHFAKVYIKDSLTRHFIPCKRKSDGMIGMYDLVEKKFYTSPNGVAFMGGVKSKVFIASLFEPAMAERRVA